MKRIILSAFLLSATFAKAQTIEDVRKIVSETNVQALVELGNQALKLDAERAERIQNYLIENPQEQYSYISKTGANYQIYDVVNGKPMYITNDNNQAALALGVNALRSGGSLGLNLEGQNMVAAVFDEGYALFNHVEFKDAAGNLRLEFPDTPIDEPAANSHGTHVSGTIAARGVNLSAKGMAPQVQLKSFNWNNDLNKLTTQAANGLLVSNHSYGVPVQNDNGVTQDASLMGTYNNQSRLFDQLLNNAPYYLHVVSAGNSGQQSYVGGTHAAFDKLTQEKVSKNNLVVANANPTTGPFGGLTGMTINATSSQGPADDGRIKPDIAGDGTNVLSTNNEGPTSYATFSGTSMASPGLTGSCVLLQQYHKQLTNNYMYSHTLRGLILHTAVDDNQVGPDPKFGWGLADIKTAAVVMEKALGPNGDRTAIMINDEMTQGATKTYNITANGTETLKVSIVWNDPAGPSQQGITNSTTPVLVNDLDVMVKQNLNFHYPYRLKMDSLMTLPNEKGVNSVDNFERVDVSGASGNYEIRVTHKGTITDGPQKYTLIVTGIQEYLSTGGYEYEDVSVYPNPVKDNLIITTGVTEVTSLEVYDIQGRLVKTNVLGANGSYVTSMEDMASGVYVVKIIGPKGTMTKKIVKS